MYLSSFSPLSAISSNVLFKSTILFLWFKYDSFNLKSTFDVSLWIILFNFSLFSLLIGDIFEHLKI